MKRSLLAAALAGCAALASPGSSEAQAPNAALLRGHVTTETGQALPRAAVSVPALNVAAVSDDSGRYSITIPDISSPRTVTVTVRRIGFESKNGTVTLRPGAASMLDFTVAAVAQRLEGVVTTALGIQREKSQLGTAQQEVSAKELTVAPTANFTDELSGKVAGMSVTSSGAEGGSTKITIRGSNSINGDNSPLYVVDGVPVTSDDRGGSYNVGSLSSSSSAGIDLGNVINDLNADDIESISVLKGPNAAALYGSRAANGVIVITTKHGSNSGGGLRTEFSTTYSGDRPSTYMNWQNQYGQGSGGQFAFVDGKGGGVNDGYDQSYGPRMNGQMIPQFDSPIVNGVRQATPFIAHPDNADSFFQTGSTMQTNLAVSGGNENANGRLSFGGGDIRGVIPDNTYRNITTNLSGNFRLGSRFTSSANVTYGDNEAHNRPGEGYDTSILEQFIWFGRQVNMDELKAEQYDPNGNLYNWNYNFHNNPYWLQYDNPEYDQRRRILGTVSGTYTIADGLSATARAGQDYYNWNINRDFAPGNIQYSDPNYQGAFSNANQNSTETNLDLLVNATRSLTQRLGFNGLLGGTLRRNLFANSNVSTSGISVPGIYNVSNAAITPTLQQFSSEHRVNSVYGSAAFTWNDWWTLEGTGRNDWSSTLPTGHDSYFYPGANTSFVLTNAVPALKSSFLSYAKLRGGIARVGSDASPYQLQTVFVGSATKFGSLPQFSLADNLANANLKPEQTTSAEVGAELAFLNNQRITLDATYYDKSTKNQILNLVIPPTSGFTTAAINAGEIVNKGIEASLTARLLESTRGLNWSSTFNYAQNRSRVVSLAPGLSTVVLGSQRSATVTATVGKPYGELYGYTFLRDSLGRLLTQNGMPIRGPQADLGNVTPQWVGGWNNTFTFRRLTASFLIDFHEGGKFFSNTNMMCDQSGMCTNTLRGRQVDWNNPGIVVQGIDQNTHQPNTINVTSEQYFQSLWLINQEYTYDDSYIKLREARLSYELPSRLAARFNAQGLTLSVFGRNLFTQTNVPNIDPEFTYGTGNDQGLEFAPMPTNRSIGVSIQYIH